MNLIDKVFFGFIVLVVMAFLSIILMIFWSLTGIPCYEKAKIYGLDPTYSIQAGCFVKLRETLVPISDIVAVEKDGKIMYTTKNTFRHEEIKNR